MAGMASREARAQSKGHTMIVQRCPRWLLLTAANPNADRNYFTVIPAATWGPHDAFALLAVALWGWTEQTRLASLRFGLIEALDAPQRLSALSPFAALLSIEDFHHSPPEVVAALYGARGPIGEPVRPGDVITVEVRGPVAALAFVGHELTSQRP